jgi:integrase
VRWWENDGKRGHRSGFASKSAGLAYFRDVVRPRLASASSVDPSTTLAAFIDIYLAAHALNVESSTLAILRDRLNRAESAFGRVPLRDLERKAPEIAAWRAGLAGGSRFGATQALRQALEQAVKWGAMQRNPAKLAGPNPQPKRGEVAPFSGDELARIVAELGHWGPLVSLAAETGLRPCEWIPLERRDVRRDEGVIVIERSFSRGQLRPYGKTARSRRRVPLSQRALEALDAMLPRIDTPLLFPSPTGRLLNLHNWRAREWMPALDAAGIDHGTIYTLRHTAITNWLAAGLTVFEVSRYAGTSVPMIDQHYGHLAIGHEDAARAKLNARLGA